MLGSAVGVSPMGTCGVCGLRARCASGEECEGGMREWRGVDLGTV